MRRARVARRLRRPRSASPRLASFHRDDQVPFAQRQRLLDRLGQPRPDSSASFFSRSMTTSMSCLICRSSFRSSVSCTTWPSTRARTKPCLQHVLEQVLVLALLAADHRGQDEELRPRRQGEDAGDDLLARLGGDRPAALRAVPLADAGVQHAQVVVDLGDRADGRARVVAGGLLLDGDRRRQAADVIDVGLGHLAQELPGVAGQGLDVPPLPLGVERVERQRDLPEPLTPVKPISLLRGRSRSTLRRLCSRAPRTTMVWCPCARRLLLSQPRVRPERRACRNGEGYR